MGAQLSRPRWSKSLLPLLAAATAIAMLILTPFWALRWYRLPFTGALYETNNVVSSINIAGWPATEAGVKYLDRLMAMNGEMQKTEFVVALAANPNAGKTSIFNSLTGAHQHVGNYPGVTVEKKEGYYRYRDLQFKVVDLPGSRTCFSPPIMTH